MSKVFVKLYARLIITGCKTWDTVPISGIEAIKLEVNELGYPELVPTEPEEITTPLEV